MMQRTAELGDPLATDLATVTPDYDSRANFARGGAELAGKVQLGAVGAGAAHRDEIREADVLEHEHDELAERAVRQILQHAQHGAPRRVTVALGELLDVALEAYQLAVERPLGQAEPTARDAEARTFPARECPGVVGARRGDQNALTYGLFAEETASPFSGVHESLERHRTAIAIEGAEELGQAVRETTTRELFERGAPITGRFEATPRRRSAFRR